MQQDFFKRLNSDNTFNKNLNDIVVLGVGSNIGNLKQNIESACKKIPLKDKRIAPTIQTKALLPKNAKKNWNLDYLNTVIIGYPIFDVLQTFLMIKNIEKNIGRQKSKKWSPRKIDIDILLWRNKIISLKFLSVPHKEFDKRYFTLYPAAKLVPGLHHPKKSISIKQMLFNYIKRQKIK